MHTTWHHVYFGLVYGLQFKIDRKNENLTITKRKTVTIQFPLCLPIVFVLILFLAFDVNSQKVEVSMVPQRENPQTHTHTPTQRDHFSTIWLKLITWALFVFSFGLDLHEKKPRFVLFFNKCHGEATTAAAAAAPQKYGHVNQLSQHYLKL